MISIITSIKNRTKVLYNGQIKPIYKNSLKSIMDSYKYCKIKIPIELILVDFGSTDTDYKWIKKYKNLQFKLIKLEETINPGKGRNVGIAHSIGNILMLLDADMIFPLNFFEVSLNHIKFNHIYFPISFEETTRRWQFFADGNVVLTKKQFKSIGNFQEKDTWGKEDNDFHKRASKLFTVKHEILLEFIHQSHSHCWNKSTLKWES